MAHSAAAPGQIQAGSASENALFTAASSPSVSSKSIEKSTQPRRTGRAAAPCWGSRTRSTNSSPVSGSARPPGASMAAQGSSMAVPLSASSARSTARSSGTVRRPAFCRCTVTANASPGRTGLAGSCKAAVTCRRSVRASHHKNAVNTIANASRNTTNGARLTAAAQNSTASNRPQPTLGAAIGRPPAWRSSAFSGKVFHRQTGTDEQCAPLQKFFCSLKKKLQAGDLLACNFFIPRRGSFSPFPAFYCPASAICSRVMGSS